MASSPKICLARSPDRVPGSSHREVPGLPCNRAINLLRGSAKSLFPTLAEAMIIHIPFCRSSSPGTVVDCTSATWLNIGCAPVLLLTGMVWISLSEVISGCGTCTCTW